VSHQDRCERSSFAATAGGRGQLRGAAGGGGRRRTGSRAAAAATEGSRPRPPATREPRKSAGLALTCRAGRYVTNRRRLDGLWGVGSRPDGGGARRSGSMIGAREHDRARASGSAHLQAVPRRGRAGAGAELLWQIARPASHAGWLLGSVTSHGGHRARRALVSALTPRRAGGRAGPTHPGGDMMARSRARADCRGRPSPGSLASGSFGGCRRAVARGA